MNDPIAIFPNETYLNGLRDADASVVDALYNEFRPPVARVIETAGGSYADGNTFFRVAVIQTARLAHLGNYPADVPVYLFLKNLAVAQYRDWLDEKGQESPAIPDISEEDMEVVAVLPDQNEMRDIRNQIRAKRQFAQLSIDDQRQILSLAKSLKDLSPEAEAIETGPYKASVGRYKNLLKESDQTWDQALPSWVVTPLTDTHFHQTRSACEALERRLYSSQVPASNENKTIKYAFIGFVLLTLGYAVFTWLNRDRTPAEVYDNNFQPPASILDDMAARYAHDSVAPVRPELCTIAFSQADAYYKKREWREAASALAGMMEDSLISCQSDALFYLAIVGLQMDRPELSIECISKIEDLERFGEDLYWYMALAYVKMAANDPSEKDIARRAVERALSNTEIPERRVQAEKMLEELAE
ncbi:MAG: hypothetical protein H7246_04500 [Phycisphaerae bacterium]|nr:hypothetical protein [Saprospiraceae bacterium]